jgi:uncharacterized protein YkwD
MGRPTRISSAVVAATIAGGATIALGATNSLDNPAAVSQQAVRLKVPTDTQPTPELRTAYELAALVNADRIGRGLPAFEWHELLWVAANGHSTEMAANGIMRHQGDNGSNAAARITAAGFHWSIWGEALGVGYTDSALLLASWLGSPPHRAILLGNFRSIGIAVVLAASGVPYWTLNVAS